MKFEVVVTILDAAGQPANKPIQFTSDTPPDTQEDNSLIVYGNEVDDEGDQEVLAVFRNWEYWRKLED